MSRRTLARAGAVGALLGGLALALAAASYFVVAPPSVSAGMSAPAPSGGYALVLSTLYLAFMVVPAAILLGVLGLYAVVADGSTAGRWGLVLCVVATLLWAVGVGLPYLYFVVLSNPWGMFQLQTALYVLQTLLLATGLGLLYLVARRTGAMGRWLPLLLVLACAVVLHAALPFVASEVAGLELPAPSQLLDTVYGLLWVVLGIAVWRHAPEAAPRGTRTVPAAI